jgi:Ca-activated chloride channel family protein
MARRSDPYALLGLVRDASPEEIKRAYHAAAQKLHPDKNQTAGETELFLEIQQAYEVLSNPARRAQLDATLPPEEELNPLVANEAYFSRANLVRMNEPQLVYALLEILPRRQEKKFISPPLNVALVLDRSTSMQGEKLDIVKSTAIQLLRGLREDDVLSVIAFSDRAEVVIPASMQHERKELEARIHMLQASGATEIYQGLEAGFKEVRRGFDRERVNHIVLLTDGHTYGDEQACLTLAEDAAIFNIGISGMGIGTDWNDIFLDALASRTGGSSAYIAKPQDIERALLEKFKSLANIFASDVQLDLTPLAGVEVKYIFRTQPEGSLIARETPLKLGPILQDASLNVLFEIIVQPSALMGDSITLLSGMLRMSVGAQPAPPIRLRLNRPIMDDAASYPPPPKILSALARLANYRLQEKAHTEAEAGEFEKATRTLKSLASNLRAEGQEGLARTALLEADNLEREHAWSAEGGKEIKYRTRGLLFSGDRKRTL